MTQTLLNFLKGWGPWQLSILIFFWKLTIGSFWSSRVAGWLGPAHEVSKLDAVGRFRPQPLPCCLNLNSCVLIWLASLSRRSMDALNGECFVPRFELPKVGDEGPYCGKGRYLWSSGLQGRNTVNWNGEERVELWWRAKNAQTPKWAVFDRVTGLSLGCFRSLSIHLGQPHHFQVEENEVGAWWWESCGGGSNPAWPREPSWVSSPSTVLFPTRAASLSCHSCC